MNPKKYQSVLKMTVSERYLSTTHTTRMIGLKVVGFTFSLTARGGQCMSVNQETFKDV